MKKTHKKLLGIGGLVFVAGITAIAYHIPDAGAVSTSASASVDVSVNVVGKNPEININSPLDGAKLANPNLHIVTRYADADEVIYTLSDGSTTVTIPSPALSGNATAEIGNSGEHDFYYDLKEFDPNTAGYGDYVLKVTVNRADVSVEDSVSFTYIPATVGTGDFSVDDKNNPIVDLNIKESVVKVAAIVFKPNGEEAFRITADTEGNSPFYLTLPFSKYSSLGNGNYTVKFITQSYNGYGVLVNDQEEDTTNLVATVAYIKKEVPPEPKPDCTTNPELPECQKPEPKPDCTTNPELPECQKPKPEPEPEPKPEPEPEPKPDDTPAIKDTDPIIDVNVDDGVEKVEIIVYDKNGKEVFRMEVPVSSITTNHIALPFDHYGLEDGDYQIAVVPYAKNEKGELVALITEEEAKKNSFRIDYDVPEVPNTGSFFASLNLSSRDFLLSGLVVFTVVTAGGIFILRRKEIRH